MRRALPALSLDQVRAFVELARAGSLKAAAQSVHLSEEGFRNRLVTLEARLGVSLYEKERGRRSDVHITQAGQLFLGKATQFLADAQHLTELFEGGRGQCDVFVAASQYLTYYVLIDLIRDFRIAFPHINVRLLTRTEQQILTALRSESDIALGICAPLEVPTDLACKLWFSLGWYLVAPRAHRLLRKPLIELEDLVDEPLIVFERGSTGRQHVLEAFFQCGLEPKIVVEATSTQVIVRMVEAGLGVTIVPLLPSGVVTRNMDVGHVPLGCDIRPIDTCIVSRPDLAADDASQELQRFLRQSFP